MKPGLMKPALANVCFSLKAETLPGILLIVSWQYRIHTLGGEFFVSLHTKRHFAAGADEDDVWERGRPGRFFGRDAPLSGT